MAKIESTQQYLDAVSHSQKADIITTIKDFMQSGDISVVERLPTQLSSVYAASLVGLAAAEMFELSLIHI